MLESKAAQTPQEVIEEIRTEEYLLDLEGESEKIRRGARSLQEKLNSALRLLSEDLYSKKTHFVLELLQNADDNDYASGAVPELAFKLSRERLVLVNNEIGFAEKNVRALCDVGKSSKAKKSGYIGEKGIGFKSVFTVSNAPEIHSNGYHFRFDRTNEANLLGYVVPHWCGAIEEVPDEVTTIILPAKDGIEFSSETIDGLDSRILLFLSNIREIRIEYANANLTYRRKDINGLSHLSTERGESGIAVLSEEIRFVRVSVSLPMEDITDEKRSDVNRSSIVLAFPLDAHGSAEPQPTSEVFAFLPIRQFGFKFSIQGDFILSSSREDIHTDRPWNKRLRDGISEAFQAAVEQFKTSESLAFSYLRFVPSEAEVIAPFFKPVVAQTIALLRETSCLISSSGTWKFPRELRYGGTLFRQLFPSAVALQLFGFDYTDSRIQSDEGLLTKLGCKPITKADCVDVFRLHLDWLRRQPLDWKAQYYAYLADQGPQEFIEAGLAKTPCVPTVAGDFVVPEQTSVFFPLSRNNEYGFESELTIIDNELLDRASTYSSRVKEFFVALKVKTDEPYELVTSHIFPRHKGEAWKRSQHKALVGHLRYLKDKLNQYLFGATSAGKTEAQAIEEVKEGLWIGTKKKSHSGAWTFQRAKNLYFSKEYNPPFCIETLIGETFDQSLLVSVDYLASGANNADPESWWEFLGRIGLRTAPKLTALPDKDWQCSVELQSLLDSPQSSVRKATLECIDQHWGEYAEHLTYSANVGRSVSRRETKFAIALRTVSAPTRRRANIPINQSYYPTPELKELFGDRPVYVDAVLTSVALLDACQITHRVDAEACIKRLKQLQAEGGDTLSQLHVIYRKLERLWNKEGAAIKQAFVQEGLIRVKGTHASWSRPNQVSWRSNSPFLDSLYPPLQGQYRDFSAFFNDKLGIPRDLPTTKWVQALARLDQVTSPDERTQEANAIYRRANRDLTPRFGREETLSPGWLKDFESEKVFLNHRNELVSNDGNLFANDSPDMASLFSDEEGISILAIPFEDVPRVGRLLLAARVPLLSKSVNVQVLDHSGGQSQDDLTALVRRVVPFVGRVVYAKNHEQFEEALANGVFVQLRGIEVIEVTELKLEATLVGVTRETSAEVATSANRILLRTGARSVKNLLAGELCRLLNASDDLADTVALVLMAADTESIEDFLRVRRIGPLPADVHAVLTGNASTLSTSEESGSESNARLDDAERGDVVAELHSDEADICAGPTEGVGCGLDAKSVSGRPERHVDIMEGLSGAQPESWQPRATGEGETEHQAPPDRSKPNQDSRNQETPNVPAGRAKPETTRLHGTGSSEPKPSNTGSGDTSTLGGKSEPMIQAPPQRPSNQGDFGEPSGWPKISRSKQTRGRAQLKGTRTGRLLSYATSTKDAQKEKDAESLVLAAAREATGRAAVDHFLSLAPTFNLWESLREMDPCNPGFDVKAVALDGADELIEVKGQSGAWTEEGVGLTPKELTTAQCWGERYWLCVVEYVHDPNRRRLFLVKNPFGATNQFRFDSGWKSVAMSESVVTLMPEVGVFVDIPDEGRGRILSSRKKGRFFKLHVILNGGRQVHRVFNPVTMNLYAE